MNTFKPILIAEDSPNDIELMLEALETYNLANRVVVVHDGVETMEYLRCEGKYANRLPGNPIVLLLDMKMPKIDGLQVLRQIRDDPAFKLLPVVMLTSSRQEKDLVMSYEYGVKAYVVKPVEFAEFLEAVKSIGMFWAILNELPDEKETTNG